MDINKPYVGQRVRTSYGKTGSVYNISEANIITLKLDDGEIGLGYPIQEPPYNGEKGWIVSSNLIVEIISDESKTTEDIDSKDINSKDIIIEDIINKDGKYKIGALYEICHVESNNEYYDILVLVSLGPFIGFISVFRGIVWTIIGAKDYEKDKVSAVEGMIRNSLYKLTYIGNMQLIVKDKMFGFYPSAVEAYKIIKNIILHNEEKQK